MAYRRYSYGETLEAPCRKDYFWIGPGIYDFSSLVNVKVVAMPVVLKYLQLILRMNYKIQNQLSEFFAWQIDS